MEELLKLWDIPEAVIENFRINGIEISHIPRLNDEFLRELCPTLGIRITLKNKIVEYNDAQAATETITNKSESTVISDTEDIPIIGDLTFSFDDLLDKSTFPEFDLKTLLTTSPCGNSILQYYVANKQLDSKRKNRLTDIIIRHLFTFIINHRLTYDDYNKITGKIITLFPKETPGTYFTRPIKKADSNRGKSMPARGKLIDKVRNLLFQSGERKRSQIGTSDETASKRNCYGILLESHSEDKQWLMLNDEPWTTVLDKWNKTAALRHGKEYDNIHEFMSEWKILKNPKSVELINQDFNFIYPDKGDSFIKNWHNFLEKVIDLKRTEISADEFKENLVLSCNSLDADELKIPTQLTLLVNLIPPKGRYSKKFKISTQECLDSIMVMIDNPGDLDTAVQHQKEKARARKLQVQPYLILLGSLQNVHQLYLVIDDITYRFDSVQKAFDILWKSFHVLNAKYPKASDHIHLVIQRCVYRITTKFDNPAPYISEILSLTN